MAGYIVLCDHNIGWQEIFQEKLAQTGIDTVSIENISEIDSHFDNSRFNQMLIARVLQLVNKRYIRENGHLSRGSLLKNVKEYEAVKSSDDVRTVNLEVDVTNLLLEIGIPAHIKGYQYIREGIMLAFYDKNMLHFITKCLYPAIAKKYNTTSSSVERTIRHAIEVAFRRGNREMLEEIFITINSKKSKPTNSEFIALLTDKLRLEYCACNAS